MLFNLYGYKLVIHLLHNRSTIQLTAVIDNKDFKDEELISIKTPLSLPYYTNSENYERVDGTISIDGKYYNYVKRRVFNDSLELLCLPNTTKTKLEKVEVDFSKSVTDNSSSENHSKKSVVVKNILPEFCEINTLTDNTPDINIIATNYSSFTIDLPSICSPVNTPPPNFMCALV